MRLCGTISIVGCGRRGRLPSRTPSPLRAGDLFYNVGVMMTTSVGEFELAVLMAVVRLRKESYGARVREDVSARAGRDYSVGAVYTTLQRLEGKGMLASWMTDPEPVRGGRAKRCFTVTPTGERAIDAARKATKRLWAGAPRWSRA